MAQCNPCGLEDYAMMPAHIHAQDAAVFAAVMLLIVVVVVWWDIRKERKENDRDRNKTLH